MKTNIKTNIIRKNTSIGEAKKILKSQGCVLNDGWEIVLGMLLQDCDYIEVQGYFTPARLVQIREK